MLCTIEKRGAVTSENTYGRPERAWDPVENVKCLYLSGRDDVVTEIEARGDKVTGKLYVMAGVDIDDCYHVKDLRHQFGEVIDSKVFEVVRVKRELSPAGKHHNVAYLKRAERCR